MQKQALLPLSHQAKGCQWSTSRDACCSAVFACKLACIVVSGLLHDITNLCRDDVVFHDDFLSIFPDYWASVPVNYEYIAVGMIPRHFNISEKTVYGEQCHTQVH